MSNFQKCLASEKNEIYVIKYTKVDVKGLSIANKND